MKEYLLSEKGKDFKANLHCHTTLSDSKLTIDEVKKNYMDKGYSIVAFTDHDVFLPHNDLSDKNFLALNSFEAEFHDWKEEYRPARRTTHINMIALDKNITKQPCFHRSEYTWYCPQSSKDMVDFDENEPDFVREYTPENINLYMKKCKEKGFFVTYNHPKWSNENYNEYSKYTEMNGLEIMNGSTLESGYMEYNFNAFDDLLRQGKKIFCLGGDDTHSNIDCFFAWTIIRANKLTYEEVAKSLKTGNFYATNGPQIKELYIEDGIMHVKTSDAKRITFSTGVRHIKSFYNKDGSSVNEGQFEIDYEHDKYVRVTVMGQDGTICFSNPYFTEKTD